MQYPPNSQNKVSFTSLGCPRNLVDTEVMIGILVHAGYEMTGSLEEADYLVVNTCGFLEAARQESSETINALLANKKEGAKVIVTGCMVSHNKEDLKNRFPNVHFFLGAGDVEGILKAVQSDARGEIFGSAKSYLEAGEVPRTLSTPLHYAYLKIAEGCKKACAYCIIPKIKGPLKSKSEEQVLKEFRSLINRGVQEVVLIAQDLGDYGKDKGAKEGKLASLLNKILEIPGNYWLRLLYLYPDEITEDLIAVIQNDPRVCKYLDMPIQHINDAVLKTMRRTTTGQEIKETISKLRNRIPGIKIRTSLIVGFPGETEEQFQELAAFLREYPLDQVGIFKYSNEPGAFSSRMAGQIDEEIKERRLKELAAIQQNAVTDLNKKMIGQKLEVIIEGYHPESDLLMVGRYYGQCPEIDGQIIINEHSKVQAFGKRYSVEVTDFAGYDLVGRVIARTSEKKSSKLQLCL